MQPDLKPGGCRADRNISKRGRRDGDPRNTCNDAKVSGRVPDSLVGAVFVMFAGIWSASRRWRGFQEECPEGSAALHEGSRNQYCIPQRLENTGHCA